MHLPPHQYRHHRLWSVLGGLLWLLLLCLPAMTQGHRDGCHRWHSCPSDTGSYVCGDLGYCSQCGDHEYCVRGQPRTATRAPTQGMGSSGHPPKARGINKKTQQTSLLGL